MGRTIGICTDPEHRGDREKEVEIKAHGRCNTCYQRFYDRMQRAILAEAPGAPRPDLSQMKYQRDLSEQRVAIGKIVLLMEKVRFNPAAMPDERKKSILDSFNLAMRVLDNLKHNHSIGIEDMPEVRLTLEEEPNLTSEVSPTSENGDSLTSNSKLELTDEVSPTTETEDSLTFDGSVKADPDIQREIAEEMKAATQPEPLIMHRRRSFYTVCGLNVRGNGGEQARENPSTHDWSKVTCKECLVEHPDAVKAAAE